MTGVEFDAFLRLTGRPPPDDLGDGEAATLACATGAGSAVIDEKKAIRIAERDFPALRVYCTLDLLSADSVGRQLGSKVLSDVVYDGIKVARMRVPREWRDWVHDLLGDRRCAELSSLK
jgi:hypothetical protein